MYKSILFTLFIAAAAQASTPWDSGVYAYDGAGNIIAIGTDRYGYDGAGRLVSATAITPQYANNKQTFDYDNYGNIRKVTTTSGTQTHVSGFAVNAATNQLTGTCPAADDCLVTSYDGAGNQRGLIPNTDPNRDEFRWDAAGMMTELNLSSRHEQYVYDANDERIVVVDVTSQTRRYSLRGGDDKVAREIQYDQHSGQWAWSKDYVYRDAAPIAAFLSGEPGTDPHRHYHLDHLGTPRLITDSGAFKRATRTYWAFGTEAPGSEPDTSERMQFTGHERDSRPGAPGHDLDYMHARYYGPMAGRFLSVDPGSMTPASPQSWNRYAYAANNPITKIDADGYSTILPAALNFPRKVSNTLARAQRLANRLQQASERLEKANMTIFKSVKSIGLHIGYKGTIPGGVNVDVGGRMTADNPAATGVEESKSHAKFAATVEVGGMKASAGEASFSVGPLGSHPSVNTSPAELSAAKEHTKGAAEDKSIKANTTKGAVGPVVEVDIPELAHGIAETVRAYRDGIDAVAEAVGVKPKHPR